MTDGTATDGIMTSTEPITPAAAPPPVEHPRELLVDEMLPEFDVTLAVHRIVDAPVATTWDALRALDLTRVHSPLIDASFWVRTLPARLRGAAPESPPPIVLGADTVALPGWVRLGERPGNELAIGAVGRFWTPSIEWYDVTAAAFRAFREPGWGKIAVSFSVRPYGAARTLVTYECRTATHDDASRRAFARYWTLIRPFVAHLMRATLDTLQDDAVQDGMSSRQPTSTPAAEVS